MTDSANHASDFGMRRIYAQPGPDEGRRVLVDRLWPRGIAKDDHAFENWLKAVAPSSPLRIWYGHSPERHDEFARRYRHELQDDAHRDAVEQLLNWRREGRVTLLTASRDVEAGHVPILVATLNESTKGDLGSARVLEAASGPALPPRAADEEREQFTGRPGGSRDPMKREHLRD